MTGPHMEVVTLSGLILSGKLLLIEITIKKFLKKHMITSKKTIQEDKEFSVSKNTLKAIFSLLAKTKLW